MTKGGFQSEPFSAQTFLPVKPSSEANPELIRRRSRQAICLPRDIIRDSIEERMKLDTVPDA